MWREIDGLRYQTVGELRVKYLEVFRQTSRSNHKQFLVRRIAWRLQATGSGMPTGLVTFKDGATTLGTGTLDGIGHATFTTSTPAVGSHSITTVYGGSASFNTSTSPALTQTVNSDPTTTTVTSSLNPSVHNQSVTFTATVVANAPGTATPTGKVTFKDGNRTLSSGSLSAGRASFTISNLSKGTHPITAVYGGSSGFLTSTSPVLTQMVK